MAVLKSLYRIHFLSLCIYTGGVTGSICLFVLVNKLLDIQLPSWILVLVVLMCLILSATLRISVWRKRKMLLTKEELNRFGTKVFFAIPGFEILVAVAGLGIILCK